MVSIKKGEQRVWANLNSSEGRRGNLKTTQPQIFLTTGHTIPPQPFSNQKSYIYHLKTTLPYNPIQTFTILAIKNPDLSKSGKSKPLISRPHIIDLSNDDYE